MNLYELALLDALSGGGGGGGTTNYNDLSNKPKINNVELTGNQTGEVLGLASQAEVDTLAANVDELIAIGGEPNLINTISVNGHELTPTEQKEVNIEAITEVQVNSVPISAQAGSVNVTVPTKVEDLSDGASYAKTSELPQKTSDLVNDGDGTGVSNPFITHAYGAQHYGIVNSISVNGTVLPVSSSKEVALQTTTISGTASSNLIKFFDHDSNVEFEVASTTNGINFTGINHVEGALYISRELLDASHAYEAFRTEQQVQEAIDNAISGITSIDFQVVTELPETGQIGVIYLILNTTSEQDMYDEYIWISGEPTGRFELIGSTSPDLTQYWAKNELTPITSAQIDALFV